MRLENFTGPFDVLLSLISRRELDLTQVALSQVTDEFLAFTSALLAPEGGEQAEDQSAAAAARSEGDRLDQISSFIVVASTLLEIKASLLLPHQSDGMPEKMRALEEQDLLFSRLLQYRAFQEAASYLADRLSDGAVSLLHRGSPLPVRTAEPLVPEDPEQLQVQKLWAMAEAALRSAFAEQHRRTAEQREALAHIHADAYSVEAESALILAQLRRSQGHLAFDLLLSACAHRLQMVVRFLSLLELFRQELVELEQEGPEERIIVSITGPRESA